MLLSFCYRHIIGIELLSTWLCGRWRNRVEMLWWWSLVVGRWWWEPHVPFLGGGRRMYSRIEIISIPYR